MSKPPESLPMTVKLLSPASMDTMPSPLPPAPVKPAVKIKTPKPNAVAKPVPKPVAKPVTPTVAPRAAATQETKVANAAPPSSEPRPAPSSTSAPPSPTPVAPPVKTSVSIPASYAASNRKPKYPSRSLQYEEEGTVILRVLVKADGTAGAIEIKSSSGYALLDESAKAAVETWRFNPATSDGKPVSEWFLVPIPFKLQS